MAYVRFASDERATPNYSSADESSLSSFLDDAEQGSVMSSDSDDGEEGGRVTRSMKKKKSNRRKARGHRKARSKSASTSRSSSQNSDVVVIEETSATNRARKPHRVELLSSQECFDTPTTSKRTNRKMSSNKRRSAKVTVASDSEDDEVSPSKRTKRSPIVLSDSDPEDEPSVDMRPSTSRITKEAVESDDSDEPLDPSYPKCAICDKRYTFEIDHRAASLKCGHFFGKPCIKKWLSAQPSCPTCRAHAAIDDLREHRGDTIKEDAREELLALEKLNKLQSKQIRRLQQDMQKLTEDHGKLADENDELNKKLKRSVADNIKMKRELDDLRAITSNQYQINSARAGTILIRPFGKHHFVAGFDARARAFDFDGESFAVGYRTRADVFSIQTAAWRDKEYVPECKSKPFHEQQPRFVLFSPGDSTVVLSGGEDKKAIIHKSGHPKDTKQFDIPNGIPAWSACWLSDDEVAIGCRDGRVYRFNLVKSHQAPCDLTGGYKHNPVIFLELDKRSGALLVGTIKEVYAILGSSILAMISCEEHEKIRSIAYHPDISDISMLAVTFRQDTGTNHKLYELTAVKGKTDIKGIDAVEVGEWQTQCLDNSTLWTNCLLAFDNDVAFVAFNEDECRLVVHDFSNKRSDVYVPFNTKDLGNPTMMKVLESDGTTQIVAVLSSKGITNFTVELG